MKGIAAMGRRCVPPVPALHSERASRALWAGSLLLLLRCIHFVSPIHSHTHTLTHIEHPLTHLPTLTHIDTHTLILNTHARTLLAGEDELAGVEALHGHEVLRVALEAVGVLELHLGHRRAAARLVHDVLHHALCCVCVWVFNVCV